MDRRDRCPGGVSPSPFAGRGAQRANEGSRQDSPRQDLALRTFAKTMRRGPTDAETRLWAILRDRRFSGFKFRRQVPIGRYIADFVCFERRLIVEADGSQHAESVKDVARDAWFKSQGFRVRRFWNADILLRSTEIKDTLWADLAGETEL